MKAIREYEINSKDRDVLVEQVLVHELFHAMHYILSDSNIKRTWLTKRDRKKKKGVKEGLADYFAYSYLQSKYEKGNAEYSKAMNELKLRWEIHEFPDYPYSGARAFLPSKDIQLQYDEQYEPGYIELFDFVKELALKGWEIPYRIIIECLNIREYDPEEIIEKYKHPEKYIARKRYPDSDEAQEKYIELIQEILCNISILRPYFKDEKYLLSCEIEDLEMLDGDLKRIVKDLSYANRRVIYGYDW